MSSTTITTNNPLEVAEDFNVSSDLPLQLTSSLRLSTVSITPSVSTSASSVSESSQTSATPSEQGDTDATSGSNTIFGISFPSPPPNTPAESYDGISVSSKPSPKSGWTGDYSDPGTSVDGMSKLRWTGEYSTSGVEPEYLMARLSTVAKMSEYEPDKAQNEDEGKFSGESSGTKRDSSASLVRDIDSEEEDVAKLARQAICRVSPHSVMESLDIKQVKSGVVTITSSIAQPQSAVVCNIEDESVPEAEEAVLSPPPQVKSTKDAELVKGEKAGTMGCMASCMSAFKMGRRSKPQIPVNQPKHATLSPKKSCLKPTPSPAGTVLDRIEEDIPLELAPAPKTRKVVKVTFDLDEAAESDKPKPRPKPRVKSRFNFSIVPQLFSKRDDEDIEDGSDEEELDDPDSPFVAQDLEIQRRLARADDYRDANELAAIIRGALDFLLVVCDRVDTVAADRNRHLLSKTGNRCLGSYTGEEKDHVNPHQYANMVDEKMYRSKETAMSYLRRR